MRVMFLKRGKRVPLGVWTNDATGGVNHVSSAPSSTSRPFLNCEKRMDDRLYGSKVELQLKPGSAPGEVGGQVA